jgi:hypothetical protein
MVRRDEAVVRILAPPFDRRAFPFRASLSRPDLTPSQTAMSNVAVTG